MLQVDLTAEVRTKFGKNAARSMRREGMTPAILYGLGSDPLALKLNSRSFTMALLKLKRQNAVFSLEVDDSGKKTKRHVIVKELQTDPLTDALVHADFFEVKLDVPMAFDVAVNYSGISTGVELGGELHVVVEKVTLKGLILDIPDSIEIDITDLNIGDKLSCGDFTIPENIEMINDKDDTCIVIAVASRVEEELEEAEEGEVEGAEEGDEQAAESGGGESESKEGNAAEAS